MADLVEFILLFSVAALAHEQSNVCKHFIDYYTNREHNPDCYYNPDIYLSVPEIIQRYGYPVETHMVTTEDGYILTMYRIPYGKNSTNTTARPPVLVQHGLAVSSMVFVDIGQKSLAFVLADNGYDVWLGNFRGTSYSANHTSLNTTNEQYWNYSFHELGIYDLATMIELVFQNTHQKLFYIGYSMGTTAYYVYNSINPELAQQRIRIAISLAPIAYVHHLETPLKVFIPQWNSIKTILKYRSNGSINQRTPQRIANREKTCLPDPIKITKCETFGNLLYGLDISQQDMETLPITAMQDLDAFSIKTVTHYIQLINSKRFQQFDYENQNTEVYGTSVVPLYNLSQINVPNYFVRANKDLLATKRNVEETYAALPQTVKPFDIFLVPYADFNHADYVVAKDVKDLLYIPIINFLKTNGTKYN